MIEREHLVIQAEASGCVVQVSLPGYGPKPLLTVQPSMARAVAADLLAAAQAAEKGPDVAGGVMDDRIALSDLRRLDLNPGDTLVVIAPLGATSEYGTVLDRHVKRHIGEHHPGVHVMTVPSGIELAVVPARGEA